MHNSQLGYIGEMSCFAELAKIGWTIYTDSSGKGLCDCIIMKNDKLLRVQIKTSATRTKYNTGYAITIGSVRSNKTLNVVHKFDNLKQDILAVYLIDLDKVFFFESSCINNSRYFAITDSFIESYTHPEVLIT